MILQIGAVPGLGSNQGVPCAVALMARKAPSGVVPAVSGTVRQIST